MEFCEVDLNCIRVTVELVYSVSITVQPTFERVSTKIRHLLSNLLLLLFIFLGWGGGFK
jgi:hypothetical protein